MKEVVGVGGDSVADGLHAIKPELTWGFNQVFDRLVDDVRRAAQGPVDPAPGRGGHALPRGHRGHARPARPALHHQLPHRPRPAARLPRGDGEGGGRRAAPHRLRREAAVRPAQDGPRGAGRRGRPAARGDPLHGVRADPAGVGHALHRVLRLHARGHRRGGRHLARDEDAIGRACRSTSCPARRSSPCPAPRASAPSAATRWCAPATSARRSGRPPRTRPTCGCCSRRSPAAWTPARPPSPACSSGTSATPSPGTWWWPTATRAPSRAAPPRRGSRCKSSFEDFVDVAAGRQDPRKLRAARTDALPRAICAGCGSAGRCSRA